MELKVLESNKIDEEVANEIVTLIKEKPNCVLGLATGSTPLGVYANLVKKYENKEVSFKNVRSFNLDEYVGLKHDNDQSYFYFMHHNLFDHTDINPNNVHVPDGINYENCLKTYDNEIKKAGGIDLQILGIGSNGHIAFNEPGTDFDSFIHLVDLKESTIKDNSRFFSSIEEVPTRAITMGLRSIMQAKRIILIAKGKNKNHAIKALFDEHGIDETLPVSVLKLHPNVEIYCDKDAAEGVIDEWKNI